jgi:hypothetical protein
MGSSRARVGEVQAHQTKQFTLNMLIFLFKSNLLFTTTGSSGAPNTAVHLEHVRIFI